MSQSVPWPGSLCPLWLIIFWVGFWPAEGTKYHAPILPSCAQAQLLFQYRQKSSYSTRGSNLQQIFLFFGFFQIWSGVKSINRSTFEDQRADIYSAPSGLQGLSFQVSVNSCCSVFFHEKNIEKLF